MIAILIILLAVVALVVVNALKDSPWGTFTVASGKMLTITFVGFEALAVSRGKGLGVGVDQVLGRDRGLRAERPEYCARRGLS